MSRDQLIELKVRTIVTRMMLRSPSGKKEQLLREIGKLKDLRSR